MTPPSLAMAASTHQSDTQDDLATACKLGSFLPLETEDLLSDYLKMLYVKFPEAENKDNYGRELKFLASKISLDGDHLEFENPSLNGRALQAQQIYCASKKKNIFGRKVCQNGIRGTHLQFCRKLGLQAPESGKDNYTYVKKRDSFYYSLHEDGTFYSGRNSILAGTSSYKVLYKFKCKIPK